jgi:hypothetical protein
MCQGFGFFAALRGARSRLSWSFSAFAGGGFAARGFLPLPLWWHPRSGVCCACGLVFLLFRWHPRYGVCSSRVAPVRGGTYFSLPPQRKVGEGLNNPFFSLDF